MESGSNFSALERKVKDGLRLLSDLELSLLYQASDKGKRVASGELRAKVAALLDDEGCIRSVAIADMVSAEVIRRRNKAE